MFILHFIITKTVVSFSPCFIKGLDGGLTPSYYLEAQHEQPEKCEVLNTVHSGT